MYEMDKGDHKQLCRLCLAIIPSGEGETIAEIERGFLEILLINIDLNISDDIVACNKCLKELQDGFNFKSACFYVDDSIAPFVATGIRVDIKEVFQREMGSTTEVNLEDVQICRLCMLVIEGKALHFNTDLDIITNKCLAEVDINTVIEPLICHRCLSHAERLNKFMETCQGVEQRIKDYCQSAGNAIPGKVLLDDLLDYKNYDILSEPIKEERPDFDVNVTMGLKKEETDAITCEEVNIKYESDKEESFNEKTEIKYRTNRKRVEKRTYNCQACEKGFNSKQALDDHLLRKHNLLHLMSHSINYCTFCAYKTAIKANMRMHVDRIHKRNSEEKFHCHNCDYFTSQKCDLRKHLRVHLNIGQHQCPPCKKKFKRKIRLDSHILTSHKYNAELIKTVTSRMHNCTFCKYGTVFKRNLCRHIESNHQSQKIGNSKYEEMGDSFPSGASNNSRKSGCLKRKRQISQSASKGSKDKSEVVMLKCENCEYETRYNSAMIRHTMKHRDPRAERKFKCDKCPYKTNFTFNLRAHHLIHKDISEVQIHKCENCEFETKYKSSMIQHIVKHRDPTEEREFKCDKCPYATDLKSYLRKHNLVHKDKFEVVMLKCENCEYETRYKSAMIRHMVKHGDSRGEKLFKCDKCPYKTNFTFNLRSHHLIHKDISKVNIHKCENCEFETRYKSSMIQHIIKHRDPAEEREFKCDKCPYATDLKSSLRKHNLIHRDKSEVEMHKCDNCEYETRHKRCMIQHILKHRDPRAEREFKCDKCPYETDFKCNLHTHNLRHKDKSEVEMHKCENCKFETRYKKNIIRHMLKHRDPKSERKF